MARKRIGEVLIERGLITAPQLDAALGHQRQGGGRLGTTLVALGALSEGQLTVTLGELQGLQVVDLSREVPDWAALHLLRPEFCERHLVLPLSLGEERGRRILRLAVADALDLPTIDAIEYQTNCKVRPVLAGASQIRAAVARWLHGGGHRNFDLGGGGEMELIRPGGVAEIVQTDTALLDSDFEVEEGEVLPLVDELAPATGRSREIFQADYDFLFGSAPKAEDRVEALERKIDALAELLERKGLCTRQELEKALGVRRSLPGHA